MGKLKGYRLGDLQLCIMKVLWERGEASVAEVHHEVGRGAGLAYTTVATMLRKMERRGLVAHRSEDRRFIYRAAIDAAAVTCSMANDLVDRVFDGSLADAVSHLLTTREVSRDELKKLEKLIAERKREL